MYGKWISLRVKKFSESYFIKPEHMHDLDELVGYGALEKTVFPYSDTTKSAFNTLLNRLPKKDAVGGYKDLLLSGCIYCYYSKKQETYVVITDMPELLRSAIDTMGGSYIKDGKKSFNVFVLEDVSRADNKSVGVYCPVTRPHEFVIADSTKDTSIFKLVNTLWEISCIANKVPIKELPEKVIKDRISCAEFSIMKPADVAGEPDEVFMKMNYFFGTSDLNLGKTPYEKVTLPGGKTVSTELDNFRRTYYSLIEVSYVDTKSVKNLPGGQGFVTVDGRRFIMRPPLSFSNAYDHVVYESMSRCGGFNFMLSPYINSLFRKDIYSERKIALNDKEAATHMGYRDLSAGASHIQKRFPTESVLLPLHPLGRIASRDFPGSKEKGQLMEFVRGLHGKLCGIGGYAITMHTNEEDNFSNCCLETILYSQLSEEVLNQYLQGRAIPDVFIAKFNTLRDGINKVYCSDQGVSGVTEESFIQDNLPIML